MDDTKLNTTMVKDSRQPRAVQQTEQHFSEVQVSRDYFC